MGRGAELAAVDEALAALGGTGPVKVLQVAGEPGIGKTRLVAEIRRRADARGCLVLSGRATEFEADLPFGMFVDAFDDHLTALGPVRLGQVDPEWVPELATVFSAFVPLAGDRPTALQAERYRTYRAVRVLWEALSRQRSLVVALDDVHWADPASVELLSYLLAHPVDAPVLAVLAFRPVPTPPRLMTSLAAAVRDGRARRLDLGPLTQAEAGELAGAGLDAHTRAELHRESGGNPFYLEQLARALSFDAASARRPVLGCGEGAVPTPVATAFASELDALAAPARLLLEAAAVVGDPFADDLAAAVAERDEREGLALLDTLVAKDLVRTTSVPRRFRFRHPIVHRAVYESTGAGWRVAAHARAAAALSGAGAPVAIVAHHVERSAKFGDEAAITALLEAAHAAIPRAPASAAHWYRAAIRLLASDDPRRLELLIARATALGAAGQLDESHEALTEALEHLPPRAEQLRVQLTAFCAGVEMLIGHRLQAGARLAKALDGLCDQQSAEAATLQVELSVLAMYSGDFPEMRARAESAITISRDRAQAPLEAAAAALRGYAAVSLADPHAADLVTAAATLFDRLDDQSLAQRIDLGWYLASAESLAERFTDCARHADRAVALARATNQSQFLAVLMLGQTFPRLFLGRVDEATSLTQAALETARLGAPANLLAWALFARSWASTYAGDASGAVVFGAEAKERLLRVTPTIVSSAASMFFGLALLEAGEPAQARLALVEALNGPPMQRYALTMLLEGLARTEIALGHVEAAAKWAAKAEATVQGAALEALFSGRAKAAVLLATGRPDEATELALRAAQSAEQVGASVEVARARVVAGQALAIAGHRSRAVAELEAAEETLAACGARGFAEQAAAELRRLGRRSGRAARRFVGAGLQALTHREREIAELIAAGMTNREVAAACYLSEKTVEGHVSRIFAKLGVTSRAAVAGLVSRDKVQIRA